MKRGTNKFEYLVLGIAVIVLLACGLMPAKAIQEGIQANLVISAPTATPFSTPIPCAKVTAIRSLNLRNAPDGQVIGWYGNGTILEVIGEPVDGWIMVQTENTQGWVSVAYVQMVVCP